MTTYRTGNAIGSADPRDLYDNAQNLDEAVNSSEPTFKDRLGNTRMTFVGMANEAGDSSVSLKAAADALREADRAEAQADRAESEVADGINLGVSQVTSFATQEADRAEAARDAAFANADVYPDTASGLAAVADGDQFLVISSDGQRYERHKKTGASTSVVVGGFLSPQGVYKGLDVTNVPDFSASHDSGQERSYFPFKFKAGRQYTVYLYFNSDLTTQYSNNDVFSLRTTTVTNPASAVDDVQVRQGTVFAGAYSVTFTATDDADFIYIYSNLVDPVDINISVADNSFTRATANSDAVHALYPPVIKIAYTYSAGVTRYIFRHEFIAGRQYRLSLVSSDAAGSPLAVALAIKALVGRDYLDPSFLIVDDHRTIIKGHQTFDFTASETTDHLYVYLNPDAALDLSLAFVDLSLVPTNAEHIAASQKAMAEYLDTPDAAAPRYSGGKIDLSPRKYSYRYLHKLSKPAGQSNPFQGSALHGDTYFALFHAGGVAAYDWATGATAPVSSFDLGSAGPDNHANCANFSGVYHDNNPDFPLLYVTDGNSGPEMRCSVENITKTGGVFSSEKVQEINLDQTGFAAAGLLEVWGWPNWLVDAENGYLYAFTAKYRTSQTQYYDQNVYIANKFRLPNVSDGAVITLGVEDLIEQKTFEYNANITQSGCIFNNKIFYTFGFGNAQHPFEIRVYDLLSNSLYASISPDVNIEPESCFVRDGKLMVLMVNGQLLEFTF